MENKNRCNICLEETCNGKRNCDCINCLVKSKCYRILHPTIRITTKCTQSCSHCCFECSPNKNDFMSIETSKAIADFLLNNNIEYINLMGGEFFCHPEWEEIFDIIIPSIKLVRLVTNGDYTEDIINKLNKFRNKLIIAVSFDKWHNNKNFESAISLCKKYSFEYSSGEGKMSNESIVPIGNSEFSYSSFSFFTTYCSEPDKKYSFLIDENGYIYKCGFGVWQYANIKDYQNGNFDQRFKEFNTAFYKAPIFNCKSCIRSYEQRKNVIRKARQCRG